MSPLSDLLAYLASVLVDHPEDILVDEEQDDGRLILKLQVRQRDIGKVIGKQGRTARAIRNLMHAAAAQRNLRVQVQFVDA
jgi:hypothetical protein